MKRTILYAALVFAALSMTTLRSTAQINVSYEGEIKIVPVRLLQSGETLHVEVDFELEDVKVTSTGGVDLIPRLVSPTDTLVLPAVSLKGRNEHLTYERNLTLMSAAQRRGHNEPYVVERVAKPKSHVINYRHTVPFQQWMKDAVLEMTCDECGCGDVLWSDVSITDSVALEFPPRVVPHLAFVQPVPEPVKGREKEIETFLDFEVNKTVIRPEYMNNPRELARIRAMIDELHTDTDITVNRLDIVGYASPEGSLEGNRRLSEGRALALRNYLSQHYSFPLSTYNVVFGGENWVGLTKALATIDIAYKDEVEAMIDNYNGQERKNRLKSLRGGQPYRWLLTNVYPGLRVAVCRVGYSIRNFDVAEAKQVIMTRPQNLSLNEMYLVANTYEVGSQEFIDVFETAVRLFPDDDTANLNAAASALMRDDVEIAGRYLDRVGDTGSAEYANTAGVLALLKGDYESAEKYLTAAHAAGLEAAAHNLEQLAKMKR